MPSLPFGGRKRAYVVNGAPSPGANSKPCWDDAPDDEPPRSASSRASPSPRPHEEPPRPPSMPQAPRPPKAPAPSLPRHHDDEEASTGGPDEWPMRREQRIDSAGRAGRRSSSASRASGAVSAAFSASKAAASRAASAARSMVSSPRVSLPHPESHMRAQPERAKQGDAAYSEDAMQESAITKQRRPRSQLAPLEHISNSDPFDKQPDEQMELCAVTGQLLTSVYQRQLSNSEAESVLESCPEVAWLAQCALNSPLPPHWKRCGMVPSGESKGETPCYANTKTEEVTDISPQVASFAKLARLAIYARKSSSEASNAALWVSASRDEALKDATTMQQGWTGPHTDEASGGEFYHCAASGDSCWTNPAAAPAYLAHVADQLLRSQAFPVDSEAAAAAANLTRSSASSSAGYCEDRETLYELASDLHRNAKRRGAGTRGSRGGEGERRHSREASRGYGCSASTASASSGEPRRSSKARHPPPSDSDSSSLPTSAAAVQKAHRSRGKTTKAAQPLIFDLYADDSYQDSEDSLPSEAAHVKPARRRPRSRHEATVMASSSASTCSGNDAAAALAGAAAAVAAAAVALAGMQGGGNASSAAGLIAAASALQAAGAPAIALPQPTGSSPNDLAAPQYLPPPASPPPASPPPALPQRLTTGLCLITPVPQTGSRVAEANAEALEAQQGRQRPVVPRLELHGLLDAEEGCDGDELTATGRSSLGESTATPHVVAAAPEKPHVPRLAISGMSTPEAQAVKVPRLAIPALDTPEAYVPVPEAKVADKPPRRLASLPTQPAPPLLNSDRQRHAGVPDLPELQSLECPKPLDLAPLREVAAGLSSAAPRNSQTAGVSAAAALLADAAAAAAEGTPAPSAVPSPCNGSGAPSIVGSSIGNAEAVATGEAVAEAAVLAAVAHAGCAGYGAGGSAEYNANVAEAVAAGTAAGRAAAAAISDALYGGAPTQPLPPPELGSTIPAAPAVVSARSMPPTSLPPFPWPAPMVAMAPTPMAPPMVAVAASGKPEAAAGFQREAAAKRPSVGGA